MTTPSVRTCVILRSGLQPRCEPPAACKTANSYTAALILIKGKLPQAGWPDRRLACCAVQVSVDALVLWVQEEKLPPYLEFTDDNQGVIFNSGIKINVRAATLRCIQRQRETQQVPRLFAC